MTIVKRKLRCILGRCRVWNDVVGSFAMYRCDFYLELEWDGERGGFDWAELVVTVFAKYQFDSDR